MIDSLSVKMIYNGVDFDVSFDSSINFLCGNSGTGKTFLMHALELYSKNNDISCRYIDYRAGDLSLDSVLSNCSDADVVLLDNADLYLTVELYSKLREMNKFLVISIKDRSILDTFGTASYIVKYSNEKLHLRRL